MKILITGAGGMLGTDLAEVLGSSFTLLGIGKRPASHLSIPYEICDLLETPRLNALVQKFRPDLVIHAAAMTQVDLCETQKEEAFAANVRATENVVAALKGSGSILWYMSTDYIFDGRKQGEYIETDKPNPLNYYGHTKYLAENVIREKAGPYTIFRIAWLYGLKGRSFVKAILEKAAKENQLQVVHDQVGRPTYTRDVAEAFLKIVNRGIDTLKSSNREIFHIANQGTCSWADFARKILEFSGRKITIENITSAELNRPAKRPLNSVLSLEKIKKNLNIELRPWSSALKDFLNRIPVSK